MESSYKIATLLYAFDGSGRALLMERLQQPNLGLWSPCGGKLDTAAGESPHQCAIREASEEMGIGLNLKEIHLTGIVSEKGIQGESHWLMFLFEVLPRLSALPAPHREGRFAFFDRSEMGSLLMPATDRQFIWPLFWRNRGGFFSAHCCCEGASARWGVEEERPSAQQL